MRNKINEKMSGIDLPVSKKRRKETGRKKTFIKWSCSHYFNIKGDSNNNVTRVSCEIWALHLHKKG